MKKRLLILYATYGSGHKAIANYVDDYFINSGEYDTLKIDVLDYANKYLGKFTDKFFDITARHLPIVWEVVYRITDNKMATPVRKLQTKVVSSKKIKKIILDFNPDVVIATHFTGATYISKLIKSGELDTHLISIVTDYKAHKIWLDSYKEEDAIIVNSPEEKRLLIKKGIKSNIIKTFGIPVSSEYSMKLYDKNKLMKKFSLTGERPIILFYGGGGNGNNMSLPYLLTLIELKIDADIFFVCGKSQELKKRAEGMVKRHNAKNIRILGYITNGPEYMMVSDFVITKPGGITITECLCFKKPMVLIKSSGGQEKDNYRYLTKKGFAINAVWKLKFGLVVRKLVNNPSMLYSMEKKLEKINKEDAMKKLYNLVGDILNEKSKTK